MIGPFFSGVASSHSLPMTAIEDIFAYLYGQHTAPEKPSATLFSHDP